MRILTILFLTFLTAFPVLAQESSGESGQPSDEITVDEGNVKNLIDTLEDEAQRSEFINNLQTLVETNEQQEEDAAILDLSGKTGGIVDAYEQFVAEIGISEGLFGQLVSTAVVILLWSVLIFLNRKLAHILRDKLLRLKAKYELSHDRFRLYARYLRYVGYVLITALAVYTMLVIWTQLDMGVSMNDTGEMILVNLLNIIIVTLVAMVIWEIINTLIERYIKNLDSSHSSRMLTLIPIIRNVFFIAFIVLFTLVLLAEIGVNIVPLLAGAGVLGIAIGLGAQTMIKDFLTGFTIIIEDLVQVGDVAKVGGQMGLVEKITIRKIQLRDLAGVVYTVPFSEITIVENWTKDFSFYVMDIGVAYREDTDEVISYLKEVDEDMRTDENYKDLILEPLEILGVDSFADSAVVIKARIKTKPIQQWAVGREFNRRMKHKFDEKGVEIPFPHQTVYFGQDKKGAAPAAPIKLYDQADTTKDSEDGAGQS
jgi:small conductance mechanosensitive channel